jgi:hypothetical protein
VQRPRTPAFQRSPGAFKYRRKLVSFEQGAQRVALELARFSATAVTITSNRAPRGFADLFRTMVGADDPGVAVYFRLNGTASHCLSCDRWDRAPDNLCAIAKHLEAIRGQLRWGAADVVQIFDGFKEKLPAQAAAKPWWHVLGFPVAPTSRSLVVEKFQELALRHHPDRPGGNLELFQEISAAYETGLEATP